MDRNFSMATPSDFTPFPWMRHAFGELGVSGNRSNTVHNPRVLLYHSCAGHSQTDEIAWCSSFVNWCMRQALISGTGLPGARSWLQWGQPLARPVFGCVTVIERPGQAWWGHVGFYTGMHHDKLLLLGGNQSNSVKIKAYDNRLLGYRWPKGMQLPDERGPIPTAWCS